MSVRERGKLDRRMLVLLVVAALAVVGVAGFLSGVPDEVPPALAYACWDPNGQCPPGINYRTAAVNVRHVVVEGVNLTPVEPQTGESVEVTAYWNTANDPCLEHVEVATADIDWTGTGWQISNFVGTVYITALGICDEQTCQDVDLEGHGYRLYARVLDPIIVSLRQHNLRRVDFATTAVDDGNELDTTTCTLGTAVSPTSQTFSATDTGFDCGFDCDVYGPTLTIQYE